MWRWGKNPYARQSGNASRNQRESEKPGRITGTVSAPGSLARTHRSIASLSSLDTGDWLPATCSVNSISKLPARVAQHLGDPPARGVLAEPGRHAAVDLQVRARRDHVDLVRRVGHRRRQRDAEHRLDQRQQGRVALARSARARRRVTGVLAEALAAAPAGPSVISYEGWWEASLLSAGASFSSALSPVRGSDA